MVVPSSYCKQPDGPFNAPEIIRGAAVTDILRLHILYNLEQMERLHIKLAKKGFCASNGKDKEFQMTTYAERQEKMLNHAAYLKWHQQDDSNQASTQTYTPNEHVHCPCFLKMAKNPTLKAVSFNKLSAEYGAVDFQDCLTDFIAQVNHPGVSAAVLRRHSADTLLPFQTVLVFHQIKFTSSNDSDNSDICDGVIIQPKHVDTHRHNVKKQPSQDVLHGDAAKEELGLACLVSSYTLPHQNSQPGKRGQQTACSKVLSRRARDT